MKWEDNALVINVKKFSERDAIVTVFSRKHGLYRAIAKGAFTKKQQANWQTGNLMYISWNARLDEHMGTFRGEMLRPYAALLMQEAFPLYVLGCICELLYISLHERDPSHSILFTTACDIIDDMAYSPNLSSDREKQQIILTKYTLFEFLLLRESGFRLDLDCCAATSSTEELIYVSPKTGRAVSKTAGKPYHEKMLKLPEFILNFSKYLSSTPVHEANISDYLSNTKNATEHIKQSDIAAALNLNGFFLKEWLLSPLSRNLPTERTRLLSNIL